MPKGYLRCALITCLHFTACFAGQDLGIESLREVDGSADTSCKDGSWCNVGPETDAVELIQSPRRAEAWRPRTRGAALSLGSVEDGRKCDQRAIQEDGPAGPPKPSVGCGAAREYALGSVQPKSMQVFEPRLGGNTTREYVVGMPARAPTLARPAPLMLWFHGQFGSAEGYAKDVGNGYRECAAANGYIAVYPQGLDDWIKDTEFSNGLPTNNGDPNAGTGWNVGSAGDETTCVTRDQIETGKFANVTESPYSCYRSCVKLNKCGRCNWSTCHDDIAFVKALIVQLSADYCIDLSRIYVGGESNGGMLTHYLSQQVPDTFAAFSPIYALPLFNYAVGKDAQLFRNAFQLRESAIIDFHGENDTTIPYKGGLGTNTGCAWYYASLEQMMGIWAAIHGCEQQASPLEVPVDVPQNQVVRCFEFGRCSTGKRVIKCLYHGEHIGEHGTKPLGGVSGSTAVWFMNQFRRATVATWLPQLAQPSL